MIARAARYDGPSLFIGPSDNSPPRMNVRNGWHMLHLAHLPATRSVTNKRRDGPEIYYVRGGSIFGKATKVAIMHFPLNYFGCEPHGTPKYSVPISGIVRVKSRRRSITMGSFAGAVFGLVGVLGA